MITPTEVQMLLVGERVSEPYIYVERLPDTKTGKPLFKIVVEREQPLFKGSMGAYTVSGVEKTLKYYRKGLWS